jgi:hypothetical protein
MRFEATENWSSTAQGTRVVFKTTPDTTATAADAVWIGQDKSLLAGGAIGNQTGVSAGGTIAQGTSRTTGVILNKPTGEITLFATTASTVGNFTVTNSFVGANDTVVVNVKSGTSNTYRAFATAIAAGSFIVYSESIVGSGATNESYKIQFTVIKGAIT